MNQNLLLFITAIMALASYRATRYALDIRYSRVFSISSSVIVSLLYFIITSVTLLIGVYFVFFIFLTHIILMFLSGRYNRSKNDSTKLDSDYNSFECDSNFSCDDLLDENNPVVKVNYSLSACEKELLEIAFNYKNSNEKITYRDVNVTSCNGVHITGFCHVRKALRTFRVDRIVNNEVIIRRTGEIITSSDWLDKVRGF